MNGSRAQTSLLVLSVVLGILGLVAGIAGVFADGTVDDPVNTFIELLLCSWEAWEGYYY